MKETVGVLILILMIFAGGITLLVLALTVFDSHQVIYAGQVTESHRAEVEAYATNGCGEVLHFRPSDEKPSRCPACNPQSNLWHYRVIVDESCPSPLFGWDVSEHSYGWKETTCMSFGALIVAFLAFGILITTEAI